MIPSNIAPDADTLLVGAGQGSLHVERYGTGGRPVVLLHGLGTSSFLWRDVAPRLAADGYSAYALDLLGHGESDRPLEADYSIAAQATCVERVLSSLRLPSAALVGIDMGGGVAQRLASTKGGLVTHLALINSVGLDECPAGDVASLQRDTARYALRVSRGLLGAAPLIQGLLEGSVADRVHMPARLVARYLAPYAGSDGVTHLLKLARAVDAEDVEDLPLGNIRAPTLIIWGEEDRWLDSGLAERLHGSIPGSQLVRLPGVARLVPEEAPDTLTQLLLELLKR